MRKLEQIKIGNKKYDKIPLHLAILAYTSTPSSIKSSKKDLLKYIDKSMENLSEEPYDASSNKSTISDIVSCSSDIKKEFAERQKFSIYIPYIQKQMFDDGKIIIIKSTLKDKINEIDAFLKNYYADIRTLNIDEDTWESICKRFALEVSLKNPSDSTIEICFESYHSPYSISTEFGGYAKINDIYHCFILSSKKELSFY